MIYRSSCFPFTLLGCVHLQRFLLFSFYEPLISAGNLTRLDRWDDASQAVVTVAYVYNGANQIQSIDTNASGDCDMETLYNYDAYGNLVNDGINTYTYDAAMQFAEVNTAVSKGRRPVRPPLTMVLSETTGTDTIYYLHGLGLVAQSDGQPKESLS